MKTWNINHTANGSVRVSGAYMTEPSGPLTIAIESNRKMYNTGHISRKHKNHNFYIQLSTVSTMIIEMSHLITILMVSFLYSLNWNTIELSWVHRQSISATVIADMVSCLHLPLPVGVTVLLSALIELMCQWQNAGHSLARPQPWLLLRREDLRPDQLATHSFKPHFHIKPSILSMDAIILPFHYKEV